MLPTVSVLLTWPPFLTDWLPPPHAQLRSWWAIRCVGIVFWLSSYLPYSTYFTLLFSTTLLALLIITRLVSSSLYRQIDEYQTGWRAALVLSIAKKFQSVVKEMLEIEVGREGRSLQREELNRQRKEYREKEKFSGLAVLGSGLEEI